jgi:hypothetical protein
MFDGINERIHTWLTAYRVEPPARAEGFEFLQVDPADESAKLCGATWG